MLPPNKTSVIDFLNDFFTSVWFCHATKFTLKKYSYQKLSSRSRLLLWLSYINLISFSTSLHLHNRRKVDLALKLFNFTMKRREIFDTYYHLKGRTQCELKKNRRKIYEFTMKEWGGMRKVNKLTLDGFSTQKGWLLSY